MGKPRPPWRVVGPRLPIQRQAWDVFRITEHLRYRVLYAARRINCQQQDAEELPCLHPFCGDAGMDRVWGRSIEPLIRLESFTDDYPSVDWFHRLRNRTQLWSARRSSLIRVPLRLFLEIEFPAGGTRH
jgi:hypothetical protein